MRLPSFPYQRPEKTPPPESVKENPLTFIPEAARSRILKVLRGDVQARGDSMEPEVRAKTLKNIIDFEEAAESKKYGGAILTPQIEADAGHEVWDEAGNWANTVNLDNSAANESDISEDKKFA